MYLSDLKILDSERGYLAEHSILRLLGYIAERDLGFHWLSSNHDVKIKQQ